MRPGKFQLAKKENMMFSNISFVDNFVDPGPLENGRYIECMLPEVEFQDFRKGAQWFTRNRQHVLIVVANSFCYSIFRDHCKPSLEWKSCIDERLAEHKAFDDWLPITSWSAAVYKGVPEDVQYVYKATTTAGKVFNFFSTLGDVAFAYAGHNVVIGDSSNNPIHT
ncbi:hypothetical protein HS088_TW19G00818 [Tripterygium wilfordii]|uniref:Uncharacterized protein n=1 Tax=Tripterygium wilfordii TaxID=458696 RepID=A0A7J7CAQ9_TRIWF|nr:hypothetical protein HS088_TW19G00818 [Tripterygium wilfordii]